MKGHLVHILSIAVVLCACSKEEKPSPQASSPPATPSLPEPRAAAQPRSAPAAVGPFKVETAGSAAQRVELSGWKAVLMSATFRIKLVKGPGLKSVTCAGFTTDDVKVPLATVMIPPLSEGETGEAECIFSAEASKIAKVKVTVD